VIGERLGVSRQAARQRYADRVERIREAIAIGSVIRGRDLESSLSAALAAATAEHLTEAGTEHLLFGLLTDGVAAATLEQLGATRDKIRDASRHLFDYPTSQALAAEPALSDEAEAALAAAEQLATERTPDCAPIIVNTPQLLAAIATNPGSRARRVLNDLGVDVADIKRLLHCYINVPAPPLAGTPDAGVQARSNRTAARSAAIPAAKSAAWSTGLTFGSAQNASPCAARSSPSPPTREPDQRPSYTLMGIREIPQVRSSFPRRLRDQRRVGPLARGVRGLRRGLIPLIGAGRDHRCGRPGRARTGEAVPQAHSDPQSRRPGPGSCQSGAITAWERRLSTVVDATTSAARGPRNRRPSRRGRASVA